MSAEAFVYDAIRTPRGKGKKDGSLHEVKPVDLVVGLLDEVRKRNDGFDPERVDDVVLGVVSPVGDQGGDIAKTAALAAGYPETVAGVQLNRFCASGLEAVNQAASRVRGGFEDLILAGGVESMSRVAMGSDGGSWAMDPATALATGFVPQGIGADLIATIEGFSRQDCDTFAVESNARAAKAWANGYFSRSVVPVVDTNGLVVLDHDEFIKPESTVEGLGKLRPSFAQVAEQGGFGNVALEKYHWIEKIDHVHHAGNSSGIVDGAAIVAVGNEQVGTDLGLTPRARIIATAVSGADPTIMLTGPAPASRKALAKAGLEVGDIDLFEINEAFAAVAMRFMRDLGISDEITNVNGGSIAMGHPLGATGAMILGTLIDELERRDLRRGLATLCVGGGMGIATIVERVMTENQSAVRYDKGADGIVVLTLDDPTASANTMNDLYRDSMAAAVDRLYAEKDDLRGVVVTSAKKTFFAGGNLNAMVQAGPDDAGDVFAMAQDVKAGLRRLETHRQAGGGGGQRGRARRRTRDRAGLPPPGRRGRPEGAARPARGDARPAARRRWRDPHRADARHRRRADGSAAPGHPLQAGRGAGAGPGRRAGRHPRGAGPGREGVDRGARRRPRGRDAAVGPRRLPDAGRHPLQPEAGRLPPGLPGDAAHAAQGRRHAGAEGDPRRRRRGRAGGLRDRDPDRVALPDPPDHAPELEEHDPGVLLRPPGDQLRFAAPRGRAAVRRPQGGRARRRNDGRRHRLLRRPLGHGRRAQGRLAGGGGQGQAATRSHCWTRRSPAAR